MFPQQMSCKMGKETRGASLEKIHAREESPCRKVEEGRSLVFSSIRKKALLLNHSEQGREGGRKGSKLGSGLMYCWVGNGEGLIPDPKSSL